MSKEVENTPFNHYRDLLARYQNLNYITPMQDGNIMRAMQDLESEIRQEFSSLMDKWVSDEEIDAWVKEHGYGGHCTQEWHEGLSEGAKWMRDKLLTQ